VYFQKNIHTSPTEEFFPRPPPTPLEISIKLDLLKCFGLREPPPCTPPGNSNPFRGQESMGIF